MSSFSAPMHPIPAVRPLERIWCEKCMRYNEEPCWNHNVHISDTVVIPYAVSSLPNQLYLDVCGNGLSDKRVLTKERLPSQTIFGPLVAPLSDTLVPPLMFACASEAGALRYFQLGSEQTVNWMKYVRFAVREGEGNVAVYARANQVFFVTMREIPAYEELRLRYSRSYAEMSGFAVPPLRSGSAASKPPLKRAVPETSKYEPKRLRTKFKSPEFVTTSDSSCDENPPSPDYPFPDNAASTPVNTSVKTTTPVQRKAIVQDTPALPSVNQTTLRKTTVLQDHRQDDANNYADTADVEPYHVPAVHEIPRKIRRKLIGYNGPQMNPAPTVPVQNVVKVMVCLPTASTARVPVLAPAPPQPPIQLVAIPAPKPPVVRIRIPRIPPPFATKMNPSRQILPKGGVVPRDEFAALSKTEPVIAVQPAPFTYEEYAVEKSANCEEPALVLVGDVVNRKNDAAEEAVDDEEQPNAKYQACRLCGHKTDTRHHRLAEHMRLRHPEYVKEHWKFPCETCGYVFATTKAVQNHVRRTHSCPKRGKSRGKRPSTEEVQTALQFIKSTGFYSYFCPDCHKHFASQPLLELHRKAHDPTAPVEPPERCCPACPFSADNFPALLEHLSEHSFNEEDKKPCMICGDYTVKTKLHIRYNHVEEIVTASADWKYPCQVCGARFFDEKTFQWHHTKEHKNGQCLYCARLTYSRPELREHIVEHMQNDRFPCPSCDQTFRRYLQATFHYRDAHDVKGVTTCHVCESVFRTAHRLQLHMKTHLGLPRKKYHKPGHKRPPGWVAPRLRMKWTEFPHRCEPCQLGFMTKLSLYKHEQRKHAADQGDSDQSGA